MAMPTTLTTVQKNIQILNSVFENGLVAPKDLTHLGLNPHTGYDQDSSAVICYNTITKIEGVMPALFHMAKGSFTVNIERKNDPFFYRLQETKKEEIEQEIIQLGKNFNLPNPLLKAHHEALEPLAYSNILGQDPSLIQEISERVSKSALFILQLEEKPLFGIDGCDELSAKLIPPEKIKYVLLPRDEFENQLEALNFPNEKIIFVDKVNSDQIIYAPNRAISLKIPSLQTPNYYDFLKAQAEIITTEGNGLEQDPIYTHMVRLKTDHDT